MEFFRNASYDFMGKSKLFLMISAVAVVASLVVLIGLRNLNIGIDFAGGTQLTLKFQQEPDVEQLRSVLGQAGFADAGIQRFGDSDANEVMIKTSLRASGDDEGSRAAITAALDAEFNTAPAGRLNLNAQGVDALSSELLGLDPDQRRAESEDAARVHYDDVAAAIMDLRKENGIFDSWEEIGALPAVTPETVAALRADSSLGTYTVLAAENVGPQIGSELRVKGIMAVLFSMIGMLGYIWLRFELRFGVGAVVAILHDVAISLGLYALMGYEFNLTTVAAFLTVVGYSVNDTVVVFDRVRENLRRSRREPLAEVLNLSINQTLSRTVLTSGTTLLVVLALFVLGGDVIRGLAFVLLVGIGVGTYSSIFVASPIVLYWEKYFGRDARQARHSSAR